MSKPSVGATVAAGTVGESTRRERPAGRRRILSRTVLDPAGLAGVLIALGCWYLASAAMGAGVLPSPHQVMANAFGNLLSSERLPGIGLPRGGYLPHILFTAANVLVGGGIGAVIGIASGLVSAENRPAAETLDPIMSLLGTIPIVIMAPFFLMWFGLSGVPQIALVALYTATVLHLFAFRGARNVSPAFMDYAATLGASGVQRFLSVRLPGAMPEIFGGLRIAFSAAWGLAAVTEMLGGRFGSGRLLVALRSVYDLTGIMAVVLLLAMLAILLDGVIVAARLFVLRWARASRLSDTSA
jgi:ABC-type nitrate/sulfonate/bicarbonate transport system permease component